MLNKRIVINFFGYMLKSIRIVIVHLFIKKEAKRICGSGNNKYSMPFPHIFFCFTPRNSSSARLGQNSRASTSISSIAKMRSSSLICLLAVIVAYRENRWLHQRCTASTSSDLRILNWLFTRDYPGSTPRYWRRFSNIAEQNGIRWDRMQ